MRARHGRLAALVSALSGLSMLFVPLRPAAGETVDDAIPAPVVESVELRDLEEPAWKELLISWTWDLDAYGRTDASGFRIEARNDTAGSGFVEMTGGRIGSVFDESRTISVSKYGEGTSGTFTAGNTYTVRMYTVGRWNQAAGVITRSDWSNEVSVTVPPWIEPDAPTDLAGTVSRNGKKVVLTWTDNSADETGFRVERRTAGGTWELLGTTPAGQATHTDVDLGELATYEWQVCAVKAGGTLTTFTPALKLRAGAKPVKLPQPVFLPPLHGDWTSDGSPGSGANSSWDLSVTRRRVTGTFISAGREFEGTLSNGRLTDKVGMRCRGLLRIDKAPSSMSDVLGDEIPVEFRIRSGADDPDAYTVVEVRFPGRTPPPGWASSVFGDFRLWMDSDRHPQAEFGFVAGASLRSIRAGDEATVVLAFQNQGETGVGAGRVGGLVRFAGARILQILLPPAGTEIVQVDDRTFSYTLCSLGPAAGVKSARTLIVVRVEAVVPLASEWAGCAVDIENIGAGGTELVFSGETNRTVEVLEVPVVR